MKINGLIAATFCFYSPDGQIDLAPIPATVENLISLGMAGVYICGTNGEGPNLTIEERMAIAEAYIAAAGGRIKVFVHVGHASIQEARKLAVHAEKQGADAISSVSAFYFKPATVAALVASMAEIAAAAPKVPFYYYHIPSLTGVGLDMVDFLQQAEKVIPNLAGIKYTAATLHEYQACLNYQSGKFDILFGYDELLLSALAVGAKGAIGSTYTFAAPIYLDLVRKFQSGDIEGARACQLESVKMIRCLGPYSSIPAQRAILKMLGTETGDCRLPLVPLSGEQQNALRSCLKDVGFFQSLEKYTQSPDVK